MRDAAPRMLSRDPRRAWPPGAFPSRPPDLELLDPPEDAVSGRSGRRMLQPAAQQVLGLLQQFATILHAEVHHLTVQQPKFHALFQDRSTPDDPSFVMLPLRSQLVDSMLLVVLTHSAPLLCLSGMPSVVNRQHLKPLPGSNFKLTQVGSLYKAVLGAGVAVSPKS